MEQVVIEKFNYLTNQYIELLINLIDYCNEKKILPKKIIFFFHHNNLLNLLLAQYTD